MRTIQVDDYTINICVNPHFWVEEFYDIPEGAEVAEIENPQEYGVPGFASIDDKEIWILAMKGHSQLDLTHTLAHEVGHIIEFSHPFNPEQVDGNDDLHEQKADHYAGFFMLVNQILELVKKELDSWQ